VSRVRFNTLIKQLTVSPPAQQLQGVTGGVSAQVPPGQVGTNRSAWHPQIAYLVVSTSDLRAGNLIAILMGMDYAEQVLDVYTGLLHNKAFRLSSSARTSTRME
jgi:hypothetical protein